MRQLARLCLFLTLWPLVLPAAAATTAVPVVTNIAGAVSLQGAGGMRRDVISSQIVHSGDVLVTGLNSLAILGLADVGRVRLGPATTATASLSAAGLALSLHSGLVCVQADAPGTRIDAGQLSFASSRKATIFNLLRNTAGTTVAVYQGQVKASGGDTVRTFDAGSAAHISGTHLASIQLANAHPQFAALRCPDSSVVTQAEAIAAKRSQTIAAATAPPATPNAQPDNSGTTNGGNAGGGGGGGGGGLIGVLLGIAGLAALAGSHGGGGGSNGAPPPGSSGPSPSPVPSASVAPSPSPTPTPGPLSVNPLSLSFTDVGDANAQPVAISETNFGGSFTVDASSCGGVATTSGSPFDGPSATLTVIPNNSGSCSIGVVDGHGGNSNVSVTVGPFGALNTDLSSVGFSGPGNTKSFNASESNYTGPIFAATSDGTVATISPATGAGPAAGFLIRSQGIGNANLVLTDDHGGQTAVLASVVLGGISLSTPTLQFAGPGDDSQRFDANDSPPVAFSATSSDPAVAVVNEDHADNHRATFEVTPVGNGKATIAVVDSDGGVAEVSVGVGTAPLLVKRHPAARSVPPHRSQRPVPAPKPGAAPKAGTALPANGPAGPVRNGRPAAALPRALPVAMHPLSVSAPVLHFSSSNFALPFAVHEDGYAGLFTVSTSNGAVATVDQTAGTGPQHVFRVVPHGAGSAVIRIADDHGGVQTISVIVEPRSPLPRMGSQRQQR